MRRFLFSLILAAFTLQASAATWATNCTAALVTAGFCTAAQQGTPVIIVGWGFAPADAQRVAAAYCAIANWQGAEDPDGLTCPQFADRQLRQTCIQEPVRRHEIAARVEAERVAAEEEVREPIADGKERDGVRVEDNGGAVRQ